MSKECDHILEIDGCDYSLELTRKNRKDIEIIYEEPFKCKHCPECGEKLDENKNPG